MAGEACFEIGGTLWSVGRQTIFQLRLKDAVRGRVMGAARFLQFGRDSGRGADHAGVIGAVASPRMALAVGAAGMLLGMLIVVSPRIWRLLSMVVTARLVLHQGYESVARHAGGCPFTGAGFDASAVGCLSF